LADDLFGSPPSILGKTTIVSARQRADLVKRLSFRLPGGRIWQNDGRFGLPARGFGKTIVVLGSRRADLAK